MRLPFNVKSIIFNLLLVCALHIAHGSAFAQPLSSSELIKNAQQYDNKTVEFEGEVIGDIMRRGSHAWINVHDGITAIGIWAPASLLQDITHTGSYKSRGDWVEVRGIFHRGCPEHGGDLDIHAQSVKKESPGRLMAEKLNLNKRNFAIVLLGVLGFVWISTLLKSR